MQHSRRHLDFIYSPREGESQVLAYSLCPSAQLFIYLFTYYSKKSYFSCTLSYGIIFFSRFYRLSQLTVGWFIAFWSLCRSVFHDKQHTGARIKLSALVSSWPEEPPPLLQQKLLIILFIEHLSIPFYHVAAKPVTICLISSLPHTNIL